VRCKKINVFSKISHYFFNYIFALHCYSCGIEQKTVPSADSRFSLIAYFVCNKKRPWVYQGGFCADLSFLLCLDLSQMNYSFATKHDINFSTVAIKPQYKKEIKRVKGILMKKIMYFTTQLFPHNKFIYTKHTS